MNYLQFIRNKVAGLRPGQRITFTALVMLEAEPRGLFSLLREIGRPADRVLDNIIGSAYEYGYFDNPEDRSTTFYRLPQPLPSDGPSRTYVSPDRRHHYTYDGRLWQPKHP